MQAFLDRSYFYFILSNTIYLGMYRTHFIDLIDRAIHQDLKIWMLEIEDCFWAIQYIKHWNVFPSSWRNSYFLRHFVSRSSLLIECHLKPNISTTIHYLISLKDDDFWSKNKWNVQWISTEWKMRKDKLHNLPLIEM